MSRLIGHAQLDSLHLSEEGTVVVGTITSGMNASMTVGAERDHKSRVVWPTVSKAADVMGFEVGHTIRPGKGSVIPTALAFTERASNHVISHVTTSVKDARSDLIFSRFLDRCGKGTLLEFIKGLGCLWRSDGHTFDVLEHRVDRAKGEHYGVTHIPQAIGSSDDLVALINHLAFEP